MFTFRIQNGYAIIMQVDTKTFSTNDVMRTKPEYAEMVCRYSNREGKLAEGYGI